MTLTPSLRPSPGEQGNDACGFHGSDSISGNVGPSVPASRNPLRPGEHWVFLCSLFTIQSDLSTI